MTARDEKVYLIGVRTASFDHCCTPASPTTAPWVATRNLLPSSDMYMNRRRGPIATRLLHMGRPTSVYLLTAELAEMTGFSPEGNLESLSIMSAGRSEWASAVQPFLRIPCLPCLE